MSILFLLSSLVYAEDVLINEVMYDAPSSQDEGTSEWIELCNAGSSVVNLAGWTIESAGSSWETSWTFSSGDTISPGEYLLVGPGGGSSDEFNPNLQNGGSSTDGIRIKNAFGQVLDTLLYDEPNDNGLESDLGSLSGPFAVDVSSGRSLGRFPDCIDTDNSAYDFADFANPTPGQPNQDQAPTSCEELGINGDAIKINEFLPNPDSDETSADDTFEWVELYNTSSSTVDIGGWSLQWGTSSFSSEFVIPNGVTIGGGDYLVIGGEGVLQADVVVPADSDLTMGSGGSNADAIRLTCGGGVADTVIYGPTDDSGIAENNDEWVDDNGNVATAVAPKPGAGTTLARRINGLDTNDSRVDFIVSLAASPGEPNAEFQCEGGGNNIKINEFFPNPDGSDSGYEWIELYNTSDQAIRLDSWSIETAASSWASKFVFPPETEIAANSFFLIGGKMVPSEVADLTSESALSLGNASTGFDGVRIIDCPGDVEDTVLYSKLAALAAEDEDVFLDDAGNETVALIPDSGFSLGRFPDGEDSNNNTADFQSNMDPTPGYANLQGGTGGSIKPSPETGCGKNPDDDGPNKCAAVTTVPNAVWIIFLAVILRRKE